MRNFRYILIIVCSVLLIIIGIYLLYRTLKAVPEGLIVASGRIEGREVVLATRISGRIHKLMYDESDEIKKNDLVATIESDQLIAQYNQTLKNIDYYKNHLDLIQIDIGYTLKDVEARINEAREHYNSAQSAYKKTLILMKNWEREFSRYEKLFHDKLVSESDFDAVKTSYTSSIEDFNRAKNEFDKTKANLDAVMARRDQIEIKRKELEETKSSLESEIEKSKELKADVAEMNVYSPINGVILSRPVENGEVISFGTPIYVAVDMDRLYLKVYISETLIGKIRLGNPVKIYIDAYPNRAFDATVTKIFQQAEFTPKNVETKEERVKLVFGVELTFKDNSERLLKPGMPADAVIKYINNVDWIKP
jgi:HlyD family secretion protein